MSNCLSPNQPNLENVRFAVDSSSLISLLLSLQGPRSRRSIEDDSCCLGLAFLFGGVLSFVIFGDLSSGSGRNRKKNEREQIYAAVFMN